MEIFFDTSVIVASSESTHPHFARAAPVVDRVLAGQDRGFISMHSIAEAFTALTRMPVQPRIHAEQATRMITDDVLPHFEAIPLIKEDYRAVLDTMVSGGWSGSKIYDALLLRCAEKCNAERIYTFNTTDFRQLAPAHLQGKICAP